MFEGRVIQVLIASPGDTMDARDAVERTILSWNRDRTKTTRVTLLPQRWEVDSVPEMGGDGQSIINRQLVDEADIVIGLFHARLGRPTIRDKSGTVEEIRRSMGRGAIVHVFFSEMPLPYNHDPEQFAQVREFRTMLEAEGLLGTFASLDDLTSKVRSCLDYDVGRLVTVDAAAEPRAILRMRFTSAGRSERLVVQNIGSAPANDVRIRLEAVGGGDVPQLIGPEDPVIETLPALAEFSFITARTMGTASQVKVTFAWREGDETFMGTQSVSLL